MPRELCLIHANCQGEPLLDLLGRSPAFAERYDARHYVNFTRQAVPGQELASCAVFLHQWLDRDWGGLASEALLARLRPGARALCLPNFLFLGYWPFWDHAPGMDFSDFFLNQLLDRGLSRAEILHIYLDADLARFHDPRPLVARSLDLERRKAERWDLPCLDWVLERWTREQLFLTVNHPGRELCIQVAQRVLAALGLPPLAEAELAGFATPFPEFEQPIHPGAAALLGLPFAGPERLYLVYGARMRFRQYAAHYIDCRRRGESDFIGYLRLAARSAPPC
jgi:hypothetical protein